MTNNDPDYERQARSLLNQHMFEHATVEALLGISYEQRTANLLALNRKPGLMQQCGPLDQDGENFLSEVSTQVLERLDLTKDTLTRTPRA